MEACDMTEFNEDYEKLLQRLAAREEEINAILEKEKRWKWLATGARNIAVYVISILGAITVGWDWLVKVIKTGVGQ